MGKKAPSFDRGAAKNILTDSLCLSSDLTARGSRYAFCKRKYLSPGQVSIIKWTKAMDSFVIVPKGAFTGNEFWALEAKVSVINIPL